VTKTKGQTVLQMQHFLSSITKRRRATQVEHTSRCPHDPYATHSSVSAHTTQKSSMAGGQRRSTPAAARKRMRGLGKRMQGYEGGRREGSRSQGSRDEGRRLRGGFGCFFGCIIITFLQAFMNPDSRSSFLFTMFGEHHIPNYLNCKFLCFLWKEIITLGRSDGVSRLLHGCAAPHTSPSVSRARSRAALQPPAHTHARRPSNCNMRLWRVSHIATCITLDLL
jgi:hypothetical protein